MVCWKDGQENWCNYAEHFMSFYCCLWPQFPKSVLTQLTNSWWANDRRFMQCLERVSQRSLTLSMFFKEKQCIKRPFCNNVFLCVYAVAGNPFNIRSLPKWCGYLLKAGVPSPLPQSRLMVIQLEIWRLFWFHLVRESCKVTSSWMSRDRRRIFSGQYGNKADN